MNPSPDLTMAAIKMAVALVVVLAILWGLYRLARKVMPVARGVGGGKMIRVVENQYLGIKKNLLLVHVPGAVLVLGVTADRIQMLTRLDDPDILAGIANDKQQSLHAGGSFRSQLQRFMKPHGNSGRQTVHPSIAE